MAGAPTPGLRAVHPQQRTHEDNILSAGLPFGTPEDALDRACGLYLGDPPA
jgi:hypothetical protein